MTSPSALLKRDSKQTIQITHPTHPFRGQTFDVVPMLGGKPDASQILIALPNGGQQLIPAEWTDQAAQIQYPPGVLFIFEHLVVLHQRLDQLLVKEEERAILMAEKHELDRPGGSHVNQQSTNPLESIEPGTTSPDCRHSGTDAATPMDARNEEAT